MRRHCLSRPTWRPSVVAERNSWGLSRKEGLEPALSELLEDTLSPEVSLEITVEGEEGLLSPAIRDQLFLILREAVRNALAHSGMSTLGVAARVTEREAVGLVEDDGSDFMEERAALVGGQCLIVSVPSKGTRVEVVVPASATRVP